MPPTAEPRQTGLDWKGFELRADDRRLYGKTYMQLQPYGAARLSAAQLRDARHRKHSDWPSGLMSFEHWCAATLYGTPSYEVLSVCY